MSYNPAVLRDVLEARSLSLAALSQRLGIEADELSRELLRQPAPKQALLNDIAAELALPSFVFFMQAAPPLNDIIPDFRSSSPSPTPKARATVESIQLAASIQRSAKLIEAAGAVRFPSFIATTPESIDQFAQEVRAFFDIGLPEQVNARDARAFYTICRKKIEDKGIFVLHDSFPEKDGSGFCLADTRFPIIVVNTKKQTRGRRLFTLVHELAHVLMGKSGVSDPFVRENAIERRCNHFAGSFLVPANFVDALLDGVRVPRAPDIDDVARISRKLKISQQATILRLEELELVSAGSHDRWLNAIHNLGNPDFQDRGGGAGGPPPQEKVKLARYGFRLANVFSAPLSEGRISEINFFRATGLKPKYQRPYFDFANSITSDDLQDAEVDDE